MSRAIPANVHRLRGNPSKLRDDQLKDGINPAVALPEPPAHLSDEARAEWARVGAQLRQYRIVSELDRAALAVYCQAWARWVQAEEQIAELGEDALIDTTPNQYKQIGVWLQISNRAVDQMHKFMGEFGLTPSARVRVQPSGQQDLFGDDDGDSGATSPARFFGA